VFVAPTTPLVEQQMESCKNTWEPLGIPKVSGSQKLAATDTCIGHESWQHSTFSWHEQHNEKGAYVAGPLLKDRPPTRTVRGPLGAISVFVALTVLLVIPNNAAFPLGKYLSSNIN
jgi:hypothetical protein